MKKLMSLMLGLAFLSGSVVLADQATKDTTKTKATKTKTKTKKAAAKKTTEEKK